MIAVLLLFLIPVGGGIPAGVLRAQALGLGWAPTAALYALSDVILALAFEPLLRLLRHGGRRVPRLVAVKAALKEALARSAAPYAGPGAGPLALVLVAFGLDPMTGRATAHLAGHGPLSGWALAIAGDLLYYALVAAATLGLNARLRNPNLTVALVLGGFLLLPMALRAVRSRLAAGA